MEEHNLSAAQSFGSDMNKNISSMQALLKKLQTDTLELKEKANGQIGKYWDISFLYPLAAKNDLVSTITRVMIAAFYIRDSSQLQ